MAGLHPDRAAVSDPKPDRVDVHDRVDLVQRPRPPLLDDLVDRVGDVRDRLVGHRRAVRDLKVLGDIAGRHAPAEQRHDHVVELGQPAHPLGNRDRLERPVAVPRHLQLNRSRSRLHGLAGHPVAGVPRPPALRRVPLVSQVVGHLGVQCRLDRLPDHVGQQAALAGQLQPLLLGLLDDPGDLPVHRHGRRNVPVDLRSFHDASVSFR